MYPDSDMIQFFQKDFNETSRFLEQNVGNKYAELVIAHIEANAQSLQ
jgi:hypothetical protein